MVTMALIADHLPVPGAAEHHLHAKEKPLSGVRPMPETLDELHAGYVYIGDLDRMPQPMLRDGLCAQHRFIIVSCVDPMLPNISYIHLPASKITYEEAFACVQEIFDLFEHRFRTQLLSCAMHERNIEALLNVAYPFFGNPLYVADAAFVLLAHSSNAVVTQPTPQWTSIVDENILSPSIANKLDASEIERLDSVHKASFIETIDAKGVQDIVAHIERNGARIANLAIIGCQTPFREYHLALADFLVECIGYILEGQRDFQRQSGTLYEQWLLMLLRGEVQSDSEIASHLANLGWDLKGGFQIAVIDFLEKPKTGTGSLAYYWRMISLMLIEQKCFIYNDAIVILFHAALGHPAEAKLSEPLVQFIRSSNLRCGISEPFPSILDAKAHYEQAKRIRCFAQADLPIVYHEDVMAKDLFSSVAFLADWKANIDASVLELCESDEHDGTAFVESLYAYLICGKSLKEAAERLNIHRNTLVYRLKKIREICDIDPVDQEKRFSLLLSCKIALERTT